METVTLYSTWPTADAAEAAARTLLEERLIACANIIPQVRSVFRWDGKVQAEAEAVIFAKTTQSCAIAARDRLLALHPYEIPCVTAFSVLPGTSAAGFLQWIADETVSSTEP